MQKTDIETGVHELGFSPELTARLDRISRNEPQALHVVMAAALVALLGRYCGQDEVVIGQPAQSGAADALVLRAALRGTLRELLAEMDAAVRDAVAHQDFPIACLASELDRDGGAGEHPYFDVAIELAGLHERSMASTAGTAGLRMVFTIVRNGSALGLRLSYDSGRFSAVGAALIGHRYELLLDRASAEPDRQLAEIDLYSELDREIIERSNTTERHFDAEATIHGVFARQAARTPDAPALLTADRTVSFAELDARSNQLAHTLRDRVGPDDVVAVVAERSVELMVAMLAVLKAGAAYLPVDPSYPPARVAYLLSDSGTRLAVAQAKYVTLAGAVPTIDLDDPASYAATTGPVDARARAGDLAYVIYTSGSTGNPKGVAVEHRSVVNRMSSVQRHYPIGPGDVVLQKTSISFDLSIAELFWWPFAGAALAMLEPAAERDPALVVAAIERHRVSTVYFVPSMLAVFLGYVDRFGEGERLGSLRQVLSIGEALTADLARRCRDVLPGARLVNLYGPTEATVDVSHYPCDDLDGLVKVPIGRPIDNTRLYVLDASGLPVPVGLPGELHIAGTGLARGYLNRTELTAQRFIDGAAVGEQRLYRTGDLARWLPDGNLDYLGRVDLQVKVRGHRVEPAEIEAHLRTYPQVRDAAVVGHDDGWQVSLRGWVVASGPASEADLKQHLRRTLPEYMVPDRIGFLDALPLNPHGKLDRTALSRPDALLARSPRHIEPRTELESTLAAIWREVLGVATLGVHDNFFALGGDSIHFVPVLAKSRAAGLNFTFQQLFKHQTVAALAASMADVAAGAPVTHDVAVRTGFQPFELLSAADRAKIPDGVEDAYPLSMLQAGLIFQTEVTGALGQYHDVLSYLIRGTFDRPAFERAVRLLVARHPILRTTYHLTGFSQFIQMVHRDIPLPLHVVDLRGLDEPEQQRWHEDWLAAEKVRQFRWQDGECVVGIHVQILGEDTYRYTVSQHNSALDGWSISLLHTQLFELYYQVRDGRTVGFPPVDNHVRNFVGLEVEAMRSPQSRDFWLHATRGSASTTLPRRPDAADTRDFRVVLHDVPLPAGLSDRVLALAESLAVPVKDVLLAAHVKVLSEVAGEREVMTGYEQSGRPELPGAETVLGLFLNTVPFRIDLVDGSWADLIMQVYRAELDLLPHRRYPMAKMKQDLGTQRMLFQTTFNFTHFYLLKSLRDLPEFALLGMRVDSETEFVFRTEFSRHFFDDDVQLLLHYHTHLFDAEQIDRIGGYFITVLESMTDAPDASHTGRSLLGEQELAVLRAGARQQAAAPPVGLTPVGMAPVAAPTAAVSRSTVDRIAAVWAEVLGLPVADIGPTDDFFALGGNSLSALRIVVELGGLITLTDLTLHPRLDQLGSVVDGRRRPAEQLLHPLSGSATVARCAVVCVPYPCGHPINFKPLAEALSARTADIAVYGVEQPGHDPNNPDKFVGVEQAARMVLAEIEAKADLPIILWGHCGGAPITVEVARLLEEQGFDLRHVFLGSKLLPPIPEMRENIEIISGWTDRDVIHYMVGETGYPELDGLSEAHTEFAGRLFRHDVCDGYRYLIDVSQRRDWKLSTPLTAVIAEDDPVLTDIRDEHLGWRLLACDVRLHLLSGGGHYFVRTNHAETAELIERAWTAAAAVVS